jgi:hypothetical protein
MPLRLEYRGYNRLFINTIWFPARELSYSLSCVKTKQPPTWDSFRQTRSVNSHKGIAFTVAILLLST